MSSSGGAEFIGNAEFAESKFAGDAWFDRAKFVKTAEFIDVEFAWDVWFGEVTFAGNSVVFDRAKFGRYREFGGARVAPDSYRVVLPAGLITRPAADGEEEGWLYVVRAEDSTEQPTEAPG